MWYDLIALAILVIFITWGASRGTLWSALRLGVMLGAYAAGIFGAHLFAPFVTERFPELELLALPLGGSIAFLLALCVLGIAAAVISKRADLNRAQESRTKSDHLGGALIGAMRGGLIVLLVGILGNYLEQAQHAGLVSELPSLEHSFIAMGSGTLAERSIEQVLDKKDPASKLTAQLAIHPAETAEKIQSVMENPRVVRLREDSTFWSRARSGDIRGAMNQLAFRRLAYDDQFRNQLAELKLIDAQTAEDPELFKKQIAETYTQLAPRIEHLKTDPAVQKLMHDEEILELARNGSITALLTHPDFIRAVQAVMSQLPADASAANPSSDEDLTKMIDESRVREEPKKEQTIYMYKTETGSMVFVDNLNAIPEKFRDQARQVALPSRDHASTD